MAISKFELLTIDATATIFKKFAAVRVLLLSIFLITVSQLSAQGGVLDLSQLNCDCSGAVDMTDTILGPVHSPAGYGKVLEIQGYGANDPMWFEQEHNTVWYKFKATHTSELAIDIIPERDEDDFDFLLFQSNDPSFCYDVDDGLHFPVRTNISRVNTELNGQTGLNWDSEDEFVAAGPGSPYSKSVMVTGGDIYYLIIDNPHRANEGHTVVLHYKDKPLDTRQRRTPTDTTTTSTVEIKTVGVVVYDENGSRVKANLSVDGVYTDEALEADSVTELFFDSDKLYKTFTVNAVRPGYMLSVTKVTSGREDTTYAEVHLRKIEVGTKVALNDIQFVGDEAEILRSSEPTLDQLIQFMLDNPTVEIEIHGHVNGPGESNKKIFKTLSKDRAEAVYNHLILAGIDKKRMDYKGFGNTEMIYENPVTDQQSEANRRVEIMITNH